MVPALLACVLWAIGPVQVPAPLEGHSVREVRIEGPSGAAETFFRLDLPRLPGAVRPAKDALPIGLVRWSTGPRTDGRPGLRVACVIDLPEIETRVFQAETSDAARRERRLVWREVRARSGRSLRCDWNPRQGLSIFEATGGDIGRRTRPDDGDPLWPLTLVEHLRRRQPAGPRSATVLDPKSGGLERWSIACGSWPWAPGLRCVSLSRADGSLAGAYLLHGGELLAFRWQRGGWLATRIPRVGFQELSRALAERQKGLAAEAGYQH